MPFESQTAALLAYAWSPRLLIFAYHRIVAEPDDMLHGEVTAAAFDGQVEWLSKHAAILALPDAIERWRSGSLPPRAACITFDDGYASNFDLALPILQRWRAVATFYIATGFLDGGRMWNDTIIEAVRRTDCEEFDLTTHGAGRFTLGISRPALAGRLLDTLRRLPYAQREQCVAAIAAQSGVVLPDDLMMSSEQVRQLGRLGMDLGGHTETHPILARLAAADALAEIQRGRAKLFDIVGSEPRTFAYPNGIPDQDYCVEHVDMVRTSGFEAAVTTAFGGVSADDDRFQLPRVIPWEQRAHAFAWRAAKASRSPPAARLQRAM
ncbi:MAG: polysaccharide deacetylase family protein [Steroidobacteraceae bacterium]